ncbi:tetratricopeptide repeat protein [Acrasis kona]|uniref:Tetratricopeptide repeat protein n=1 Tax=Acrasis kona TaxID=1008807 RepID=A0AAW2Z2K7_9EUKA
MHRYTEQANFLAWDNNIDGAIKMLEPYSDKVPNAAVELCLMNMTKSIMKSVGNSGDKNSDEMLEQISRAEVFVDQSINSDSLLLEQAKTTIEMNKKISEGDCHRKPPLGVQLDSLTDVQLINNFRKNSQMLYSELTVMRALVQIQSAAYIRCCYNIRSAWKTYDTLYNDIFVNNEHRDDITHDNFIHQDVQAGVKCGQALFYYGMSMIPNSVQWVLSYLSGMTADRKKGVELLEEVVEQRGRLSPFAAVLLSMHCIMMSTGFKTRQHKLDKYKNKLHDTISEFPNGTGFLFIASQYLRKVGDMDQSIALCEKAIRSSEDRLDFTPRGLSTDLAIYVTRGQFEEPCRLLHDAVIKDTTTFGGKSFAALTLATCLSMLGRMDERNELLDKLQDHFNKQNPRWEKYMMSKEQVIKMVRSREAETTLVLLLSTFERLYLKDRLTEFKSTANLHIRPLLRSLRASYNKMDKKDCMFESRVAFVLAEAVLMARMGDDMKIVKDKLNKVVAVAEKLHHEKQWAVYAFFELAEIEFNSENRDLKKVEDYMQCCMAIKEYSVEDLYAPRIKCANRQLEKARST